MRINEALARINQVAPGTRESDGKKQVKPTGQSFASLLEKAKKSEGLTFSKHAQQRMEQRLISLDSTEMEKLSNAVKAAEEKGVKDSLILMNGRAFIVNIPENVVVTVLAEDETGEKKVFTNLDGAVII